MTLFKRLLALLMAPVAACTTAEPDWRDDPQAYLERDPCGPNASAAFASMVDSILAGCVPEPDAVAGTAGALGADDLY